jgi:hypothetical protein
MALDVEFKEKDLVKVINAVNPAYHDAGDVLPVWRVKNKERMLILPDASGGATYYSFDDVLLLPKEPEHVNNMSESEQLLKAKALLKQVMVNYQFTASIAEREGYETNYDQDKVLVGYFISQSPTPKGIDL